MKTALFMILAGCWSCSSAFDMQSTGMGRLTGAGSDKASDAKDSEQSSAATDKDEKIQDPKAVAGSYLTMQNAEIYCAVLPSTSRWQLKCEAGLRDEHDAFVNPGHFSDDTVIDWTHASITNTVISFQANCGQEKVQTTYSWCFDPSETEIETKIGVPLSLGADARTVETTIKIPGKNQLVMVDLGAKLLLKGEVMAALDIFTGQSGLAECEAKPSLPAGLSLEKTTTSCRLLGSPAAVAGRAAFQIEARNQGQQIIATAKMTLQTLNKEFIAVFDPDLGVDDAVNEIKIGLAWNSSSSPIHFNIDWGDNVTESIDDTKIVKPANPFQGYIAHVYADSSINYEIRISDPLEFLSLAAGGSKDIVEIKQWGQLVANSAIFSGSANLERVSANDSLYFDKSNTIENLFNGCTKLTSIANIGSWDLSRVSKFANAFAGTSLLDVDLSSWNFALIGSRKNISTSFDIPGAMSNQHYSSLLEALNKQAVGKDIRLNASLQKYEPSAAPARESLIQKFNWTIVDGGSL